MIKLGILNKHEYTLITDLLENDFSEHESKDVTPILLQRQDNDVHEEITHLISGQFSEKDLDNLPNVQHIFVPYTGLDGLDLDLLHSHKIHVHNTSSHAPFIAERALALLLALQGKLLFSHQKLVQRDWSRDGRGHYTEFWHSLFHKKVAIYGYGHIGKHLHHLLKPFACSVGILEYKNRTYEDSMNFPTLETLADWCDIMVVTVPLNDSTLGSVNQSVLTPLKGKTLVNVARGPIIDEDALYDTLKNIGLYGFASDVWYCYPSKDQPFMYPSNYNLHQFDNVIMTPHDGGAEISSRRVRYKDTLRQVIKSTSQ